MHFDNVLAEFCNGNTVYTYTSTNTQKICFAYNDVGTWEMYYHPLQIFANHKTNFGFQVIYVKLFNIYKYDRFRDETG